MSGCQTKWKNEQVAGLGIGAAYAPRGRPRTWAGSLNLDIKGHRVSDFPHAIHRGGDLGDFDHYPNKGLWILEIQIARPSKAYGAFYEDLLA